MDLNFIINRNFKNITNNDNYKFDEKIELVNDFDHNKIVIINGSLKSYDLQFEETEKVKIENLKSLDRSYNRLKIILIILIKLCLLAGLIWKYKNYKCKKPIIIYNYFTELITRLLITQIR